MNKPNLSFIYDAIVVAWETKEAKFLHIEFSPSHILRIKLDKVAGENKAEK